MTDLSARLKQLKKAMTPGPWTWRGGAPQFYGLEGKDSQDVLRPLDGAVYSEYSSDSATIQIRCDEDAAVIALGDLFIPLVMKLLIARCPVSYLGAPTTEECIAADQCGCSRGTLLAQIAERLTGAGQ